MTLAYQSCSVVKKATGSSALLVADVGFLCKNKKYVRIKLLEISKQIWKQSEGTKQTLSQSINSQTNNYKSDIT